MKSDCLNPLQVTEVTINRVADIVRIMPSFEDGPVPNPPAPGLSRLRCYFFFEHEDPAVKLYHTKCRTWWRTYLKERCYDMDKEYSRVVSMLAVPQLMKEINILRDPQQAVGRFEIMALDRDLP